MAIQTINSTDNGANSLVKINDNFTDLDTTKADLASPTFTGTPSLPTGTTAVTQSQGDNSTKIATTAYVDNASGSTSSTSGVSSGPASSSTQTITHGLGRTPTIIRLTGFGANSNPKSASFGTYNASGNKCIYFSGGTGNFTTTSSFAINLNNAGVAEATGVVGNLTSTTFDIVWTAAATTTNTNFLWEAQ